MTSESRYRGAPPPQSDPRPTYPVLRPQRHGPLDVTILADTIQGVLTHWIESDEASTGSTVVCTQHDGECMHHDDPLEWSGWLCVWDHANKKKSILRLGPKDADKLAKTLGIDLKWAGRRVTIRPVNNGEGRTIAVQIPDTQAGAVSLAEFDMDRTICLILGCPRLPRQTPRTKGDDPSEVPT